MYLSLSPVALKMAGSVLRGIYEACAAAGVFRLSEGLSIANRPPRVYDGLSEEFLLKEARVFERRKNSIFHLGLEASRAMPDGL